MSQDMDHHILGSTEQPCWHCGDPTQARRLSYVGSERPEWADLEDDQAKRTGIQVRR